MAWYALRECDERDHVECRGARHQVDPDDHTLSDPGPGGIQFTVYPKTCRTCGATIIHRPRRDTMLKLATQRMKAALWPRKVQISRVGERPTKWTWMWRGHRLFTRPVKGAARSPNA
jgi:hypothetical protein